MIGSLVRIGKRGKGEAVVAVMLDSAGIHPDEGQILGGIRTLLQVKD
jgi:hypothetical protein